MRRPADWQPLADADPVPGDPYDVAGLGRQFRATAELIASASQRLKTMCTDEFWDSDAGAAFRQRSDDTAGKLSKAYARYDAAAAALGTDPGDASPSTPARPNYAGSLEEAQAQSARALPAAQDAAATQRAVMSQLQAYPQILAPDSLVPDGSGRLRPALLDPPEVLALKRHYNAAAGDLASAAAMLARAMQLRDAAAANASGLIASVIDSDGLGDSWWDHVTSFIDEHAALLSTISAIAGWVATACGTLALVVGWIPVVGQALAAVLGTVALAASVVALISDVLLEIGGKGSWADIALDVIAVASFGLGRAAAGALRDSSVLARFTASSEGLKAAVSGLMEGDAWLAGGEHGLDEALPQAWGEIKQATGDWEKDEVKLAEEHAPRSWPTWGDILRGFQPASILKDGFKDIGDLKWSSWKELASSATWKDARFFVGDPEIHEALQSVDRLGDLGKLDRVRAFVANVSSNHDMWRYVTVPAVAADFANHVLTETGLKGRVLHDTGLGWAAG